LSKKSSKPVKENGMKQIDFENLPQDEQRLPDGSILISNDLETIIHNSMMPYAEYVILDRALPRIEDGLKPVQRRILYAMYDMGITPDKPYKKSARIVGECLGKYHPHGDTSVYDAMVRLAQPFNMNMPLVDGQGNFGSVDGDPAAAMRYTEARLTPLAMELLADIDKNTVRWSRNFDDTTKEPDILPGRFPNLLVNGASGIAVAMATNIPPHNLAEVIDGVIAYINNPKITLDKMMKIIKGPDFPTGGYVISGDGLELAYKTGRGKIYIRAKVHIENISNDREQIVFTELPYQVNKSRLLESILKLREDKKEQLAGISEILDESDNEGMRGVIKLRKDANAKEILQYLFKYTELQVSYGINMVAIAEGKPQQMGLLEIIAHYAKYQEEVVTNRTKYLLEQAIERIHILEGLVIAVTNIDEVIKIIKSSQNIPQARQRLRERFDLSEKQAQAILDIKLARLTKLEIDNLIKEKEDLAKMIVRYREILNSKPALLQVIKEELSAIKRNYKRPRLSEIADSEEEIVVRSENDEKPVEKVVFALAYDGSFKCIPQKNYNMSSKDAVDRNGFYDIYTQVIETMTDSKVMIFSDMGNCYQSVLGDIPQQKYHEKGTNLSDIFNAQPGEKAVKAILIPEEIEGKELLFFTRQGMVKRSPWEDYFLTKSGFNGMNCKEGDEVINVETLDPGKNIVAVTEGGMSIRFALSEVPQQGRVAGGVKGINIPEYENVLFMGQVADGDEIVLVTNKGFAKKVKVEEISLIGRNNKGVKIITMEGNGDLLLFAGVKGKYELACVNAASTVIASLDELSVENRAHKGRPLNKKKSYSFTDIIGYFK
jgi:DNA gyrase subunit A